MQLTPIGFLETIKAGTNPHDALIQWGRQRRQRTEKLQKIRLEAISKQQNTGPLEIADMPTTIIQSQKVQSMQLPSVRADSKGRPYLASDNACIDSVDLAEFLVLKYRSTYGEYPTAIMLSALRYWGRQDDYFIMGNRYIPYVYDHDIGSIFEVAVRGDNRDDWML